MKKLFIFVFLLSLMSCRKDLYYENSTNLSENQLNRARELLMNNPPPGKDFFSVGNKIVDFICDMKGLQRHQVTFEASFNSDLGFDELDYHDVIRFCEKEFTISFEDSQLDEVVTINDLINLCFQVIIEEIIVRPPTSGPGNSNPEDEPKPNNGIGGSGGGLGGSGGVPCYGQLVLDSKIAPTRASGYKGGTYGETRRDAKGKPKFHDGLDIATPIGTPVYFTHTGKVVRIVKNFGNSYVASSYGNIVEIEAEVNGVLYNILYGHLEMVYPEIVEGQTYQIGTEFGRSGISGNAGKKNGKVQEDLVPHVHIRVRFNKLKINPEDIMQSRFDKTTGKYKLKC